MKKIARLLCALLTISFLVACSSGNEKEVNVGENEIQEQSNEENEEVIEKSIEQRIKLENGRGYLVDGNTVYFALATDTQDKYVCNSPDVNEDEAEYFWTILFTDGTNDYDIGTFWWKYVSDNYPENVELGLEEMQSSIARKKEDGGYRMVSDVNVNSNKGLLIWNFELSDELNIQTDKIEILDHTIRGTSAITDIFNRVDEFIQAGDLENAYAILSQSCNENNYVAILAKENEILPQIRGNNLSVDILEDGKISVTVEAKEKLNEILVNYSGPTVREIIEGVTTDFGIVIDFYEKIGAPELYGVGTYHEINFNEGSDIKMPASRMKHKLLKSGSSRIISGDGWDVIKDVNCKVSGNTITWTFEMPDGQNPYTFYIGIIHDMDETYWDNLGYN